MVELTESSREVIRALLEAPLAWQTPAELAAAVGRDPEETTDLVAILDAGGWLSAWESSGGGGPAVTLSARGAARLDARLVEQGPDQMPRWATREQPEPGVPKALGVFRGERAASLDLVVDPRSLLDDEPGSFELVGSPSAPDSGAPGRTARVERLPRPSLLLGTGMTPWPGPGPARAEGRCCPACGDRPLGPSTYCLLCDRWGLDDRLVAVAPLPSRAAVARDPGDVRRRREQEARARKAKRKLRLAAVEAELKEKRAAKRRASSS